MERLRCRHMAPNSQGLGGKGSLSGNRPQKMEPSDRSNLCHYLPDLCNHLFSFGRGPSTPGFWQATEASATLDGALFNKAQIIESFSKDMETQMWEKAAGYPLSTGMEKGVTTDQEGQVSIDQGNFMAARALDFLVCGAIHEPHLPADGSIPNQIFCVRCDQRALATRKHDLWECPGNSMINHTHDYIRPPCSIGPTILGHRSSFVCSWPLAARLVTCVRARRMLGIRMWESSGFQECVSDSVLIASDGSGGSREIPKSVRQVALEWPTFSLQPLSDTSFKLLRTGFLGGQVPGRQTVPSAELWGAIQILSRIEPNSD